MNAEETVLRILLIEDIRGDAQLVQESLSSIASFTSEIRWIQTLSDVPEPPYAPDCVLLDLSLPDTEGLCTVEACSARIPNAPIVVLTCSEDSDAALTALRSGAEEYLTKGDAHPKMLERAITHAVERFHLKARLQAQAREIALSEQRIKAVVEHLADGLVVVSERGRVVMANAAARAMLDAAGPNGTRLININLDADGSVTTLDLEDGSTLQVETRSAPVIWQSRPARAISIHNVTELMENQHLRFERLRLQSMARLAGGVSHGLNNVLQAVGTAAELLAMDSGSATAKRARETIAAEVARGAALTRQLLLASGQDVASGVTVDVAESLRLLEEALSSSAPEGVAIRVDVPDGEIPVTIDRHSFELLVQNLVGNSLDAMQGRSGQISIALDNATRNGWVTLRVRDSGVGIEPAALERVCDPFYTTKSGGVCHGLGLAVVRGIVEQIGGTIDISSLRGQGTTVQVALPVEAPSDVERTPSEAVPGAIQEMPILVVEDEDAARDGIVSVLKALGHNVTAAATAEQAIDLASDYGCRLLLTDYALPGMNGDDLIRVFRQLEPELPVVVMSGYTSSPTIRRLVEDHAVAFLAKPFTTAQLESALQRASEVRTRIET